ncbi:MAG: HD domain-containing protein [Clostridia bacterium]|nr:HD domain-containing protein [Clostridia bacterium]
MKQQPVDERRQNTFPYVLGLCICGLLINFIGVRIALQFRLPVFLDSVGTILTAALGGYIPGIIVGFLTNMINGIFDYNTAFYGSISVLLALTASVCAKRGYFRSIPRMILPVIYFALIGGGIGSILTWCLYGGGIGEGISRPLAMAFLESGKMNVFFSQLSADLLIDLLDKAITVVLVAIVWRLIPERIMNRFLFPRNQRRNRLETAIKTRGISLRTKVLIIISVTILIIASVVTSISLTLYRDALILEEARMSAGVANAAMAAIDPDRVDLYIEKGRELEDYEAVSDRLASIADSSEDISYVYAYKILEDGCHVVFDPDTAEGPGSEPGTVIEFDDAFKAYVPALLEGKPIDPIVSNESYGWLLTIYQPLYDANGKCQCYVGVDMSMTRIMETELVFLARVISLFLGFFIIVLAVAVAAADYGIVWPLNAISNASKVDPNDPASRADSLKQLEQLRISTGDEIENLYKTVTNSTQEVLTYIDDVQKKNEKISRLQNGLIIVLADLVESRDKCTGNHIRNTASYVRIIMKKMKELGLHRDKITDNYIEEVVGAAPLHDVGKIHIPDNILNKPGRLDEDEYTLMKSHAAVGGEIIDRVMEMVSDESGYLEEAHNLTEYHHERWDGKGYPCGLAGEAIPLSARIMAVADVFDALVSRRSYKAGFPFEKAISIIQEGAGTQFDPEVVDVFLQCQDEVRRVSEEANIKNAKEY